MPTHALLSLFPHCGAAYPASPVSCDNHPETEAEDCLGSVIGQAVLINMPTSAMTTPVPEPHHSFCRKSCFLACPTSDNITHHFLTQMHHHAVRILYEAPHHFRCAGHGCTVDDPVICAPTEVADLLLHHCTICIERWNRPHFAHP
jgi:hypothetical protein